MAAIADGFERRACDAATGVLEFIEGGRGEAVVYLHGAGGPRVSPALREACSERHLLVPVYPGFEGTSTHEDVAGPRALAETLASFIRQQCEVACDLVAQSLGGHVALWIAALNPGLVRSMLLECPAGFRTGERPQGDPRQLLYAHPERIPAEPQYRSPHAQSNQLAADRYRMAAFDEALWERLPFVECPTLLLHGMLDRLIDPDVSRRLGLRLPRAAFEAVEDAGHAIEIDRPDLFAQYARRLFASVAPGGRFPATT
jgi:pimeloyl-ACP methyl ester carboxylesterase